MDDRLRSLLEARLIATLGTTEPDGSIYLSAVWFLARDEEILIATGGRTRKARNAAERRDAAVLIDMRGSGALQGAAAAGTVDVVRGTDARELNEQVWRKYLTAEGLVHPEVGQSIREHDDVTIRFRAVEWRTWRTDEDFGGAMELPGMTYALDG